MLFLLQSQASKASSKNNQPEEREKQPEEKGGNKTEEAVSEEEDEANKVEEECVVCRKSFLGSKALRKHMSEHLVKKKPVHECKHCGVKFADKSKLICHNVLNHNTGSKPVPAETGLPCNKCDKTFKNTGELICHQVLNHKKK